jgi:uncharacterized membrane protein YvlD (DUF360 family)
MIRFLVNTAVYMAAAAIGLLIADVALEGLTIDYPVAFITAALLFGIIQAVISPFFAKVAEENAAMLTGGVGLFSALIALLVTATISNGLAIEGALTWVWAALIIWLGSMIAGFLLKITVAKRIIKEVRD